MPGQKGNSGGKRGRSGRKSKAEELGLVALWDASWPAEQRAEVVAALHAAAVGGNVQAASLLLSYAYGRPTERTEHTGKDGGPIRIAKAEDLTDDELAAIANQ